MYISYFIFIQFIKFYSTFILFDLAGGFAMIGVIVYGTLDGLDSSKLHFSFGFCIIAALAAFAAGALITIGRNKQTR